MEELLKAPVTPFLTADIPGIGGTIREIPEDFQVTELPLYEPCGEGEHLYVTVEKRGIPTLEAVRRLSRSLGVAEREVGYAGLKDARALTVQTYSFPRIDPEQAMALSIPGLKVLAASRHKNKLRLGHLRGNRFSIRIRGTATGGGEIASAVLSTLQKRGVPNFFGPQRYGLQGNSAIVGRALLANDHRGAVRAIIGEAELVQDPRWQQAITLFHAGEINAAAELFPPQCRTERELARRLCSRPDDWQGALRTLPVRLVRLYLSAYQSLLFDRLLTERFPAFDRVMTGDLAYKHANGACFLVEDEAIEAPRAALFEISPSGPLFGCRMTKPAGVPLQLEEALLSAQGITPAAFDLPGPLRMEGERRPLRVPITDIQVQGDQEGVLLQFALPKGAYATSVLREVMKSEPSVDR